MLDDSELEWSFMGGTGLFLQGVDIVPKDIDVLTTKEGVLLTDNLLSNHRIAAPEYRITEKETETTKVRLRAFFGTYEMRDIQVDVVAELTYWREGRWRNLFNLSDAIKDELCGYKLSFFPLELELRRSRETGRIRRAELIEQTLSQESRHETG